MSVRQLPANLSPFKNNSVTGADFTVGAAHATDVNVAVQLTYGGDIAQRAGVLAYISDDAAGDSIAATVPDGGVVIGTDGVAIPIVADGAFLLITEADGSVDLDITHSGGADTFYLIIVLPSGELVASTVITFT